MSIATATLLSQNKQQNSQVLDFDIIEIDKSNSIYYSFDNTAPVISMDIAFKHAGYALDHKDKLGLTYVLLYLFKNSEIVPEPEELQNLVEQYGIKLEFNIDAENLYISIKSISSFKKQFMEILGYFLEPEFTNEKALKQAKENILEYHKINQGNAHFMAGRALEEALFADTDLAKNAYGNSKTMANIQLSDLTDLIHTRLTQKNINFAISGDISKKDAVALYHEISEGLNPRYDLSYKNYDMEYIKTDNNIKLEKEQVLIKTYIPSVPKSHNNFYKYYIANYIIGGAGLNSILSQALREDAGLTYSVYSYFDIHNNFSVWLAEMSTDKKNYKKAITLLKETLAKVANDGVTEEDLARAKKYLIGSYDIYFNTNEKVSSYLLDTKLRKVSPAIIKSRNKIITSYSLEEINAAIKKLIRTDEISIITVGDI